MSAFGMIANLQALVIGAVLLWAGGWKIFSPAAETAAIQSALSMLVRQPRATHIMYRLIGAAEVAIALLLLLPPHRWWAPRMATGLTAGFVIYLFVARHLAPRRPCGCLGKRATPVSWRSITRAGLLLVGTLVGWAAQHFWLAAVLASPWALMAIVGEVLLLLGLSPEIGWERIGTVMQRHRQRTRGEEACTTASLPQTEILRLLHASIPYQQFSPFLAFEIVEQWSEDCWHFISYRARYEGSDALAIFALQVTSDLYQVRAALVDESARAILASIGPLVHDKARIDDPLPHVWWSDQRRVADAIPPS